MADIHPDLLKDLAAHEARLTAALQPVPLRLTPAALLETALGLESLKSGADAAL
jgi:hypothetical protein